MNISQVEDVFSKFASKEKLPNLILVGEHGTGKKQAVDKLVRRFLVDEEDYLNLCFTIHGSINRSKDIINTTNKRSMIEDGITLTDFLKVRIPHGKRKIVVVHNIDDMMMEAQHAFRRPMEKNTQASFIFIANDINQVVVPLITRCIVFKLLLQRPKDSLRLLKTMIPVSNTSDELIKTVVKDAGGDFRKLSHHASIIRHYLSTFSPESQLNKYQKIFNTPPFTTLLEILRDIQQGLPSFCKIQTELIDHGYSYYDITNTLTELVVGMEDELPSSFRTHVLEQISKNYVQHNSAVENVHIHCVFAEMYKQ